MRKRRVRGTIPNGVEPALRAGQRNEVAWFDFPFQRELLADQQRFDAVGIAREVELARHDALQCLVVFPLALWIDALRDNSTCISAKRQQHLLVDGRNDGLYSRQVGEFLDEVFVVANPAGAGPGQRDVRFHSEQSILERLAKTSVHRQRDNQRRDARGNTYDGKCGDQPQNGRAIGRPQIAARDKPFKLHEGQAS